MVAGGEGGQVGAEFREEGGDRGDLEPRHLREIGPEDPVELGPEIEARGLPTRLAATGGRGRERVRGEIDRGGERAEARLDLARRTPRSGAGHAGTTPGPGGG